MAAHLPGGQLLIAPMSASTPIAITSRPVTPLPGMVVDTSSSTSSSNPLQTPRTSFGSPASPQYQSPLMRTPCEIIHKVLCSSGVQDPIGLSRAAKTCKELRSLIYENPDSALWRDIHNDLYDDPRATGPSKGEVDWQKNVQQREFVSRIAREWGEDRFGELVSLPREQSDRQPKVLEPICETLLGLLSDIPPLPPAQDSDDVALLTDDISPRSSESLNIPLLESILRSPLFAHLYFHLSYRCTKPSLRPLSGQNANPLRRPQREDIHPGLSLLHCLLPPDFEIENELHRTHRGHLREMVYSGNNYSVKNDWGPFTSEGGVDWRLLDAISSVMMANAKDVIALGEDAWRLALQPLSFGLEAVRGWGWHNLTRPADLGSGEIWDWAGVEGVWCGSYAFLDYADWVTLNQPRILPIGRQLGPLDLTRYSEAIGDLLHMHLSIDRPTDKPADARPPVRSNIPTGNLLPPIHFHGRSAQQGSTWPSAAASFVKGTVQLTTDWPPQVRWTMVIRYGGEDRWRAEGVQVGGRGSKRGFLGVWTDATREEHSPNGPAWYWKG